MTQEIGLKSIPSDVIHTHIFPYFSEDTFFAFRLVDKGSQQIVDSRLMLLWGNLMRNPPAGPVALHTLPPLIIGDEQSSAAVSLYFFKRMADAFPGVGTIPQRFDLGSEDVKALQQQSQEALDHALLAIWPEIVRSFGNPGLTLTTVNEIRDWLNDPNHAALLGLIGNIWFNKLQLMALPPEISKLNLVHLTLTGSKLKGLPDEIRNLTRLTSLDVSVNHLRDRDLHIIKHLGLISLDLSCNNFTTFPDVSMFTQLENLGLVRNQFNTLPENFDLLTKLRDLMLDGNPLRTVPAPICRMTQLTTLSLLRVQLEELPEEIGQLVQLKGLHLAENRLTSLPRSIGQLTQLKELTIMCNPLVYVPATILNLNPDIDDVLWRYRVEIAYPARGALAKLYQANMERKSKSEIQEIFATLHQSDKQLIAAKVWSEAGKPKTEDYFQWAEHHAFDYMILFVTAVKEAIRSKYESLSQEQKAQVYRQIYELAGRPPRGNEMFADQRGQIERREISVENWGIVQAISNLPRLADAMDPQT